MSSTVRVAAGEEKRSGGEEKRSDGTIDINSALGRAPCEKDTRLDLDHGW